MLLAITVESRWTDDTAIASCRGRVVYGATSHYLRTTASCLILRHRRVVLDLSGVTYLDARGVGTLAALIRLAQWSGGRLAFALASERVRCLLALAGLDTQFEYVTLDGWPEVPLPSSRTA